MVHYAIVVLTVLVLCQLAATSEIGEQVIDDSIGLVQTNLGSIIKGSIHVVEHLEWQAQAEQITATAKGRRAGVVDSASKNIVAAAASASIESSNVKDDEAQTAIGTATVTTQHLSTADTADVNRVQSTKDSSTEVLQPKHTTQLGEMNCAERAAKSAAHQLEEFVKQMHAKGPEASVHATFRILQLTKAVEEQLVHIRKERSTASVDGHLPLGKSTSATSATAPEPVTEAALVEKSATDNEHPATASHAADDCKGQFKSQMRRHFASMLHRPRPHQPKPKADDVSSKVLPANANEGSQHT